MVTASIAARRAELPLKIVSSEELNLCREAVLALALTREEMQGPRPCNFRGLSTDRWRFRLMPCHAMP